MNTDILEQALHALSLEEVKSVRQLADQLFARLVQPLKQVRVEQEFDFDATIREAMRTGELMPAYVRKEKPHHKSKLVIAMSMSGIDRCFAVGLIPLLAQLKKYLNFRLYIYTDDLVEAKFSDDGFIENDCDIAWNNVIGPCVFKRLSELVLDRQETKLLLVDSLGGETENDSVWYHYANQDILNEVHETQRKFMGMFSPWEKTRQYLKGDYEKLATIPSSMLPREWENKVVENTMQRWVQTPALHEYLVRYIFNPHFGEHKHGSCEVKPDWEYIDEYMPLIKEKFKSVHILTPSYGEKTRTMLHRLKEGLFVDFLHKANSLEGFAQTLVNIVYGRETNKLTKPVVRFSTHVHHEDNEEEENEYHSELVQTLRDCFYDCEKLENYLPKTTITHEIRKRGNDFLSTIEVPYDDVEMNIGFSNLFPSWWQLDPMWGTYGKIVHAKKIINFIKTHRVVCNSCGDMHLTLHENNMALEEPEYYKHHTRALKKYVDDGLSLYCDRYQEWFEKLPLRNVVWCTVGKFNAKTLSISATPSENQDEQRATIFHEQAHWAEHVCPAIGVFTNGMLKRLTGNIEKIVPVGIGEYAGEVLPNYTPWIKKYAGKWYRKYHKDLPNPTEFFSVHAEYFRSPESLVTLLEHDIEKVKAIAFIYMGGPLAATERAVLTRKKTSLKEIEQKNERANAYKEHRKRGRPRKIVEERTPYVPPPQPEPKKNSFGI